MYTCQLVCCRIEGLPNPTCPPLARHPIAPHVHVSLPTPTHLKHVLLPIADDAKVLGGGYSDTARYEGAELDRVRVIGRPTSPHGSNPALGAPRRPWSAGLRSVLV